MNGTPQVIVYPPGQPTQQQQNVAGPPNGIASQQNMVAPTHAYAPPLYSQNVVSPAYPPQANPPPQGVPLPQNVAAPNHAAPGAPTSYSQNVVVANSPSSNRPLASKGISPVENQ
uniref:Uncharacterized protein n=1 Tax=Panagrolaimus sp. ES5 TaxID=591445 RepID=A0AC34GLM6_9BILA